MIGEIRRCNICTNGGILAAILIAALFASAQVACLTHTHCEGADCFEHKEGSPAPHLAGHHEDKADHECGHEAGTDCEGEHQEHDIHHYSHDGKTHPKRRFTTPVDEFEYAETAVEEAPAPALVEWLPMVAGSPPLERYGLIFAERAPPLS
jgi:hypothetical protein